MPEQEPSTTVSCSACGASRYTERIVDAAGNVVRDVDEPLSDHRGHGTAKRGGSRPGSGAGGL
jgi:hypothetical protein